MPKVDHHAACMDTPPQYVSVGPNDIAYRIIGAGPPLVLISGWPFNSTTYKQVLPYLSTHFQCVLLDSPGLGDTGWHSKTDFTFPGQAQTISDFLDKLGIDRYYLMAHDTGATIARLMAAEHEDRLRGLVLLNTEIPHEKPPWFPLYARLMRIPGARFFFSLLLRSQAFLKSPMGFGGCYSNTSLINTQFKSSYITPLIDDAYRLEGVRRYLSIGLDLNLINNLSKVHARIHSPTTFIWGQADPTFSVTGARRMARDFPNVEGFIEIDKGKLLAHEEFPEQVANAVLSAFRLGEHL